MSTPIPAQRRRRIPVWETCQRCGTVTVRPHDDRDGRVDPDTREPHTVLVCLNRQRGDHPA